MNPEDSIEMNLLLHQAVEDVASDRFPINMKEVLYLVALRAQAALGNPSETIGLLDYQ